MLILSNRCYHQSADGKTKRLSNFLWSMVINDNNKKNDSTYFDLKFRAPGGR